MRYRDGSTLVGLKSNFTSGPSMTVSKGVENGVNGRKE